MKLIIAIAVVAATLAGAPGVSIAQSAAAASALPADPWPRDLSLSNAAVLVYQPQVNKWDGNQIEFRAALDERVIILRARLKHFDRRCDACEYAVVRRLYLHYSFIGFDLEEWFALADGFTFFFQP